MGVFSAEQQIGSDEFGVKVISIGGPADKFELATQRDGRLGDVENYIEFSIQEQVVVNSQQPLKFEKGLLYSGIKNLDQVIESKKVEPGMQLTRVVHRYALWNFHMENESPAILVIKTDIFNSYLEREKAVLKLVGERKGDFPGVDPYPEFQADVPIEDIEEIWISEDTYERYEKIVGGEGDLSSVGDTDFNETFRHLLKTGKIKVIEGLRHSNIKNDVSSMNTAEKHIERYCLKRNFLKEFALFSIETRPYEGSLSKDDVITDEDGTNYYFEEFNDKETSERKDMRNTRIIVGSTGDEYEFEWLQPDQYYMKRFISAKQGIDVHFDQSQRIRHIRYEDTMVDEFHYDDKDYHVVIVRKDPSQAIKIFKYYPRKTAQIDQDREKIQTVDLVGIDGEPEDESMAGEDDSDVALKVRGIAGYRRDRKTQPKKINRVPKGFWSKDRVVEAIKLLHGKVSLSQTDVEKDESGKILKILQGHYGYHITGHALVVAASKPHRKAC